MPVIQRKVTIAGNTSIDNLVAGSQYEFARRRCIISGAIVADAAGIVGQVSSGGDIVMEQFPLAVRTGFPVIPDDFVFTDVMEVGDRLTVPIQNTVAGARDVSLIIQIQEIA